MIRNALKSAVESAVRDLVASGKLPETASGVPVEISDTKSAEHGDFACNFAMVATKRIGLPPRQIGELLQERLAEQEDLFASIELAGPGFINLRLQPTAISRHVSTILDRGIALSQTDSGGGEKINVEFVSVNPNGPITVGSGRGAAFGDTLCRVLGAAGFQPHREYYINDGVNSEQMRLFAESVRHYYRTSAGKESEFPEKGYKGEYVLEVANELSETLGPDHAEEPIGWFQSASQDLMLQRQRDDLHRFRVVFDTWFSEQEMHEAGKVAVGLERLARAGNSYMAVKPAESEEDPEDELLAEGSAFPRDSVNEALWLRSTAFGDDKDRVLVRADGRPAYIAADVAYLQDKFDRGFSKLKLILGPDHHGYVGRMYAACQALGHTTGPDGEFEIIIYQIVRFVKDGKPAPMRKRDGNIYELRDLIIELGASAAPNSDKQEQERIGADVARFFFLMRSHETHMDFDIDLATKQSDENPVFYAQYAHARICSVLEKAAEAGIDHSKGFNASLLTNPRELALIKKTLDLPFEVDRSARDYGVHRLTTFSVELARAFHHFYDVCRVVQPDDLELSKSRVALCHAARIGLAAAFDLLGVSAPERMERSISPVS